MEVMKFVAYCGGVTLEFRMDDCMPGALNAITWGLASTRPCPALQGIHAAGGAASVISADISSSEQLAEGTGKATSGSATVSPRDSLGPPTTVPASSSLGWQDASLGVGAPPLPAGRAIAGATVQVDSVSRKPLHMICTLGAPHALSATDVLTIDLAPREDRQPVILATLKHNGVVVMQQALPCSTISSLQMYPFVTLQPGMTVSLHRALTPSPLFTWYLNSTAPASSSDVNFAELDTCVRFASQSPALPPLPSLAAVAVELQGSVTFSAGRHRWTVQLDNYNATSTHIFVGVVNVGVGGSASETASMAGGFLGSSGGMFRSIPSSLSIAAGSGAVTATSAAESTLTAALPGSSSTEPLSDALVNSPCGPQKWGVWIRMPGEQALMFDELAVP